MYSLNYLRDDLEMEELKNLRQEYHDNPCLETRFYLAKKLSKCGRDSKDRTQKLAYLLEATELFEENYREDPRYVTRRNLAISYTQYADYSKHKEYFLKATELYEINVTEKPCFESRKELSRLYSMLIFGTDSTTPEGIKTIKELYLKKVPLDEANYNETPNFNTLNYISRTYYFLAHIILEENGPNALIEAEEWLMKALDLHEKDYKENPNKPLSKMKLVKAYHDLLHLERRKDTPESKQKARMWQTKIDEKITLPFIKS